MEKRQQFQVSPKTFTTPNYTSLLKIRGDNLCLAICKTLLTADRKSRQSNNESKLCDIL